MKFLWMFWAIITFSIQATISRSSEENNELLESTVNDRYYPRYHIAAPTGFLNDPTAFIFFQDKYHLFYQYNPSSCHEPGIAHWGHAISNDLIHWHHLPIAIFPNSPYDLTGAFSGSAIVDNDQVYIFYTANLNQSDPIYFHLESQAMVISKDCETFEKYEKNPILMAERHQPNIRDPKVWKYNETYYMIIGASYNNDTLGRVLLFKSDDMLSWEEVSIIGESYGPMGYMWECPDLFSLNGTYVFLFSPQGVKPDGDKFRNLHQTGYMLGKFNYDTLIFEPTSEFRELDHGHDFYTTSTILDDKGRRLFVAWLDTWDQYYPEEQDGWTGLLSLPRELTLSSDGYLLQTPLQDMEQAREKLLYSGKGTGEVVIILDNKAGELIIESSRTEENFNLHIESDNDSLNDNMHSSVKITYDAINKKIIFDRKGKDAIRRTEWQPKGKLKWRIFIDASSIEMFCGEGEVTFSSRFFPEGSIRVRPGTGSYAEIFTAYSLKRTVPKP